MITVPFFSNSDSKGFTFVEILIVIAVMSVIGIPSFAAYSNYNASQTITTAVASVTDSLQTGKSQALSIYTPAGCTSLQSYSFKTTATGYSLSADCSTGGGKIANTVKSLPSGLSMNATTITFSALTGVANPAGSVTIKNGNTTVKTITVTSGGAIQVQ